MADIGRKASTWSTRFGFFMAAIGSSVGLGNFWRFPYTAGENGGGAFILAYLLCVALIGLPLLIGEYALGRKSGMSAVEGVQSLARASSKSLNWGAVGWVGTMASFFIVSFYCVISAWILAYIFQAFLGNFTSISAADSAANFGQTITNIPLILSCLFIFILLNSLVVGRGVRDGIERAASILMPAFFILLLGVVGIALYIGDVGATLSFIFEPSWKNVSFKTFLEALGQAFFSLGVGIGLMITYGAYLSKDTNIPRSGFIVAGSDTLVALIAGFAIFPIVFAFGADPAGGPGLFFVSLPIAFGQMPLGHIFGGVFFLLALFAAFTSSISLMEVSISWLEERHGVTRFGASCGMGFTLFVIGAGYIFSVNYIDFVDFLTGSIMLPLGGLLVALFIGWAIDKSMLVSEVGDNAFAHLWYWLMKWFVPVFVGLILILGSLDKLQSLGVLGSLGPLDYLFNNKVGS